MPVPPVSDAPVEATRALLAALRLALTIINKHVSVEQLSAASLSALLTAAEVLEAWEETDLLDD